MPLHPAACSPEFDPEAPGSLAAQNGVRPLPTKSVSGQNFRASSECLYRPTAGYKHELAGFPAQLTGVVMIRYELLRSVSVTRLSLVILAGSAAILSAQTVKIEGLIKARSGATMVVQTVDSPKIVVLLTDNTQAGQIQGVLKVRRKEMSMAALIPGLAVQVEGTYDDQHQLVAKTVKFKGNDLERAQSIQAGLHETKAQAEENRADLEKQSAALQAQHEALKQQQVALSAQEERISANREKIAANKAAIQAAVARFGQLDDYYILDEVTVYFANGKTALDPKYQPQLHELAKKAMTIEAYMVQVVGYASASGSAALNQKLSEDRAHNVANFLIQRGNIPLTNMLAPGAMGESRQVGNDKTADGEAQNRRVLVRILQNKGVAGVSDPSF
jgi:outer membrane protein OmpA-like peptidoglycan-associated protein